MLGMVLMLLAPMAAVAEEGPNATELAKASQNPVGNLTAIPFQFNYLSGGPLGDQTLSNLNVQPVVPLKVGSKWLLIARTIVPFIDIPVADSASGISQRVKGTGDIQQQLFFTPSHPGDPTLGFGPVLSYPTATNPLSVTGDWAAGPAAVFVKMTGPWVLGALATQLWTFAGDGKGPDVNLLTVQPFINYNLADGWSISFSPVITSNWSAPSGEEWTVPLGLGLTKVAAIGHQPMNLSVQYYHNVERPSTTGDNQIRFVVAPLYPFKR
jgi:hypothetical protein